MKNDENYGKVIILNGPPRSGKSSIAEVIQNQFNGLWMNIGVDHFMKMIPKKFQPGIGLRPGGERPDLERLIPTWYKALYETVASFSRLGLNVVVDVGHHEGYTITLNTLSHCCHILKGYPVLFVGVHCSLETLMERRINTWNMGYNLDGSIPQAVLLWQQLVHQPGIYDIEVDTSKGTPKMCAEQIHQRLISASTPTAFEKLEKRVTDLKE